MQRSTGGTELGSQSMVASTSSAPPNVLIPSVVPSGIWALTTSVISGFPSHELSIIDVAAREPTLPEFSSSSERG
jgi:hypothetical protein